MKQLCLLISYASDPRILEPLVREEKLCLGHNDCIWLWHLTPNSSDFLSSEEAFDKLPQCTVPEMQRSNLAPVILQLKALGIDNVLRFHFMSVSPAFCLEHSPVSVRTLDRAEHITLPFYFHLTHVSCATLHQALARYGEVEPDMVDAVASTRLLVGRQVTGWWQSWARCSETQRKGPHLVSHVRSETWNPSRISPDGGWGEPGQRVCVGLREGASQLGESCRGCPCGWSHSQLFLETGFQEWSYWVKRPWAFCTSLTRGQIALCLTSGSAPCPSHGASLRPCYFLRSFCWFD